MNEELLNHLMPITAEEQEILSGKTQIKKERYTTDKQFIIDSKKMLHKGDLIDIRPHTRFIHFPKHKHNYVEIIYMCQGSTTHIINGTETILLEEGNLLFLNQNATQEILPAKEKDLAVNFIVLPEFFDHPFSMIDENTILHDFLISTLQKEISPISYLHFDVKDILPIQNLVENLIWSILNNDSNKQSIRQTTMGLLFMNLTNHLEALQSRPTANHLQLLVIDAMRYIEENYRNGSLEEFAAQKRLPTYQISRYLKKQTGQSFKQLLQKKRLNQATYLLTHSNMTLENIISSIGYNNSSYFYNLFRDTYYVTPKEYRCNRNLATSDR
ncbi:MAG: AraC family transcriptional regulator [bacterium]|nr:AraC family transcriptional regulator [bacterium]